MTIRRLSPRRCPTTAAILRLKRQLEALGFTVSDVNPDGVRVNQPPFGTVVYSEKPERIDYTVSRKGIS